MPATHELATIEEIRQIIQESFPNASKIELAETGHRVEGTIVWDGFKGMDDNDRYKLVTEKVRDKLRYRGLNLGMIFALAPREEL